MLVVTFATLVGDRLALHHHPEGLLPDRGHRLHRRRRPKAPSDISFQAMVERQREIAEIIRKDHGGRLRQLDGRHRRPEPDHQLRPHVHRAQAQEGARENVDASHPASAPQRQRRSPAWSTYFQNVQNINITGRISKSEFQYTLQSSDTETLYRVGAGDARQDRQARRPARRHDRPLHQESADDDRGRPREGGGLRHLGRSDPPGAVQRLRHPPGRRPSTRRRTTTRSSWRACRNSRPIRTACRRSSSRPTLDERRRRRGVGRDRQRRAARDHRSRCRRSPSSPRRSGRCRSITRASSRR